uniref:Uncharacterized protein n=1 Tax=Odontella aurita TaxID=265563 RepID=A0A7S4K128_9STRA|mmetsp:Transcript_58408/g.174008  ORF Transcript_58408/g.174008 Transcript_58408/m.174008 type:complete len:165 (+) Transcript_58408:163-657(+)
MPCVTMPYKLRLLIASMTVLLLFPRNTESLQCSTGRRTFFIKAAAAAAATSTCAIATTAACCTEAANAAIDVSGLRVVEQQQRPPPTVAPGRPPNQPPSGPLAGTKLGFQVGGGPRPEEEVRKIDEPRYAAVRKAQGLGPLWLEGVPIEQPQTDKAKTETKWMR